MYKSVLALVFLLTGCTAIGGMENALPFDNPDDAFVFSHRTGVVEGDVFGFNQDGSRVTHHFIPVGVILDRNTYVISTGTWLGTSDDFMSVGFGGEVDVARLIAAAETYCADIGYVRVGTGANIWAGADDSSLVEFCVPENTLLPPMYKSGDRVPR